MPVSDVSRTRAELSRVTQRLLVAYGPTVPARRVARCVARCADELVIDEGMTPALPAAVERLAAQRLRQCPGHAGDTSPEAVPEVAPATAPDTSPQPLPTC
jgi:hypothetical protein